MIYLYKYKLFVVTRSQDHGDKVFGIDHALLVDFHVVKSVFDFLVGELIAEVQ